MKAIKRPELDEVVAQAWVDLDTGVNIGRHPFHTPVLATVGASGPEARTVVLRKADAQKRQLICHTDRRSPKALAWMESPSLPVSWLFYDREAKIQIRTKGTATLEWENDLVRRRWERSNPSSQICYRQKLAPGTALDDSEQPTDELDEGFDQFAVLISTVTYMDWLFLRAAGHWRAEFHWQNDQWRGQWIAP